MKPRKRQIDLGMEFGFTEIGRLVFRNHCGVVIAIHSVFGFNHSHNPNQSAGIR